MRDFILLLFFVNVLQSMAFLPLPIAQPSALNRQPNNALLVNKIPPVRAVNVHRGKPLLLKKTDTPKVSMSLSLPFGVGGHFFKRPESISINPIVPGSINPFKFDSIIFGGGDNNGGDLFERPVDFFGSSDDQFGIWYQNGTNSNKTNSSSEADMQRLLKAIEISHNIEIIYAAECGEKEWSIDFIDSTPHMCFVYIQNDKRPYRSLISEHITSASDGIQWTGYDITGLIDDAWQMQPEVMELLQAKTVYRPEDKRYSIAQKMRGVLLQKPRVSGLVNHYWSNSRKAFIRLFSDEKGSVRLSDYLTIARNVAIIDWLNRTHISTWSKNPKQPKPVEKLVELNFNVLLHDLKGHMSDELHKALVDLANMTKKSNKRDRVGQIQAVNDYIYETLRNAYNILQQAQQNEVKLSVISGDFLKVLEGTLITKFEKLPY